ncbi:hypothetical protein AXK56_09245 [Tsukamurella pulmonis]|uniref:Uncharacterized protein n=1 Tax=Tsukamurella pulmonis TaxID=47312 RepID=A0A1H1BLT6_9ACTN|nr:hypothetical protein [Tsukamurella pulmonis]KXO90282.1 hypothetical protein AXK56_09245 [Tsukamurella pulmonis]SDQ52985.1 hypothetical protein SAMN04489765_0761 [Tsukamurella pulmonis]SUP24898.1 Uncharacterised protein [Tsukamurella pulmonis]
MAAARRKMPAKVTSAQLRAHYDAEVERLNDELDERGEDGFELDDADRAFIDRLAVIADEILILEKDIERNGPLVKSAVTGDTRANPAVALHRGLVQDFGKIIATLDRRLAATSGIEPATSTTGPKPGTPKGFRGEYKPRATGTDGGNVVAMPRPAPKHSSAGGRRMRNT